MQNEEMGFDRRGDERQDLSLQIVLLDQEGKTINVSASGVFFEIITSDLDVFAPGSQVPVKISAVQNVAGLSGREIRLDGKGFVVRKEIKDVTSRGNKVHVALQFRDKLSISGS